MIYHPEGYHPDGWQFLHIKSEKESIVKLLATWSGGYLHGDSWRLNSGVTRIEFSDEGILVHGHSGSVYVLNPSREGIISGIGVSALESWKEKYPYIEIEKISLGKAVTLIGEQNEN